jgi:small redox-active disulfide protein 2
MLSIKVLGPGCPNCQRLEGITRQAVEQLGQEAEISKVTEHQEIIALGVMNTPGLMVNERVVSSGRIPALEEVISWLADALAAA